MKKWRVACLLFMVSVAIPAVADEKPLIISGMTNYAPVMWQVNNGYAGIAKELACRVFDELAVKYEFRVLPWKRAQEDAGTGAIDLISGIYINEARQRFLDYSVPFMSDPGVLFVKKGQRFHYREWKDLIGKRGITNQGYSWGEAFDRFLLDKLQVDRVDNPKQAFYMLIRSDRDIDYYLYGLIPGLIVINRLGIADAVEYLPDYVTDEKFYFAFSKKSPYRGLLPRVNQTLERLVAEEYIDYLMSKYIESYQDSRAHKSR